jgi:hypothetical protein
MPLPGAVRRPAVVVGQAVFVLGNFQSGRM